jgi:Kazal-type serine protease inhibitor domain
MKNIMYAMALLLALLGTGCRKNNLTVPTPTEVTQLASGGTLTNVCIPNPPPTCPPCAVIYNPVCGCDGVTYFNACIALCVGITSYTQGPCGCLGQPQKVCNCPKNIDPVCGCNGVTYDNACYAECAGVLSYTAGACPPPYKLANR